MRNYNRVGLILKAVMLMLCVIALTGCWWHKTIVLPEAQALKISKGGSAPFEGWLLTDSAVVKLLEKAEMCEKK